MTTKPATPLPHSLAHSNAGMAQGIISADTGEDVAIFCGKAKSRHNAAYYLHAANAYPELVAALRSIMAEYVGDRGSHNVVGSAGIAADKARALLRRLGEL